MPSVITNNGFETDTSQWVGYGGSTLTRTNEVTAPEGTFQGKSVVAGAPNDYGFQSDGLAPTPPVNSIWRARCRMRGIAATVGDLMIVTMQERGGGAGNQNGNGEGITLTTSYQRSSWSRRRVADAARDNMVLFAIGTGPTALDAVYMDEVFFDRVDTNPLEAEVLSNNSIVSYYKMDDPNEGSNTLVDLVGNNHGIYSSTVSMLQTPLVNDGYHSAAFHNSLADAAVVGTPVHRFSGAAAFTVCGWFQLNAYNAGSGHWGVNCLDTTNGWAIQMNSASQVEFFRQGTLLTYDHGSSLLGQRFFAAIRYDGSDLTANINGVDVDSDVSVGSITTHSANFTIGAYSMGGSGWEGPIDEIMVFDDDIGEAATLAIFEAGEIPEKQTTYYRSTRTMGRR